MRWLGTLLLLTALACGNGANGGKDSGTVGGASGGIDVGGAGGGGPGVAGAIGDSPGVAGASGGGGPGGGGAGGGGAGVAGAGGSAVVPCLDAKNGDPCGATFQMCGPQDGYGCTKTCIGGAWSVSCNNPPTCATSVVGQGQRCDPSVPLTCGPFAIDSLCGAVSVTASCTGVGWAYNLPCNPDCESLSKTDCAKHTGCAWAAPCPSQFLPPVAPRCIDFPPRLGFCSSSTACPTGTICVDAALNPQDISSGDCTGAGTAASLCIQPVAPFGG